MVSFEIFVKAMTPSLSELKVLPSFCFAFIIPDDVAASNMYVKTYVVFLMLVSFQNGDQYCNGKEQNGTNKKEYIQGSCRIGDF